ncbi:secreted cell surface protein with Por secretion system C-terminal sorting domain [Psychroflexus torquis ATCC 700755]|uniref:Secreted cell surface protein with Por secretion system C-terminal sorting domain n=1 Tax=Psychroflexus torquis (strain ATCC 700755 / CIP 106069 / ACAM 623) TaxID=313595 RepID=K4IH38_PSYTT|nr:T9SS type A sorting domain-containing protein [Psychroflexus torquis]AFU69098.1 secreted cell surface protein with Por secretion system C-terminal sorting domain [Psychroflexus torquis ATCC 700755]
MKKIILFLALVLSVSTQAQVTQIWTDYGGFWTSSSTSINSVKPDNSHNLLAFRSDGINYSTGVDDAKLNTNGVSFTPLNIRALPIPTLPLPIPVETFYLVVLGQLADGMDNGADDGPTNPFAPITQGSEVASYLTDGINGLDLGTGIANIPSGTTSRFNLSTGGIKTSQIGDGLPDILISQTAKPTRIGDKTDRLRFVDDNDEIVGEEVLINLSSTTDYPVVGNWQTDFYKFESTQERDALVNIEKPLSFFAEDLSYFGITSANASDAVALIYEPRGSSDPAFIAFNEPSLGVASQLVVNSQPTEQECDGTLPESILVQVEDSDGASVLQEDLLITATKVSGPGDLLGTTKELTNKSGLATFNDLELSVGGTHIIEFSYTSLDSATTTEITFSASCSGVPVEWTGEVSTAWNNVGNWDGTEIPNANFNVIIPNGRLRYPVLVSDAGANNLEMGDGTSITLNGRLFAINGSMANVASGATVDGSVTGSTLYFSNQEAAQTIPSGFISGDLSNLTVENPDGVTTNSDISLLEVFTLKDGDFTIASSSTFTFKSSATKTAVLDRVPSGSSISGCVVIERFIPSGKRAFRFLSSPVTTSVSCGKPTIQDNLQEGGQITDIENTPVVDPNPGYGIHITGSTTGANGFDATNTGNPSMFTFNESTQDWENIPNTDDGSGLSSGQSFLALIRGSRALDLTVDNIQSGPETRLRFTGELATGNWDVLSSDLGPDLVDFSFIGNPYQAQIDLKAFLESNNVSGLRTDYVYVFDPTIGTSGSYVTVDLSTNNGTNNVAGSAADKYLQPHQAFFAETSATDPSVTFGEIYKKTGALAFVGNAVFRTPPSNGSLNTELNINLKRNVDLESFVVDGARLVMHDYYSNEVNEKDALKFSNSEESIALLNSLDGIEDYLSVEKRATPIEGEVVQLSIWNYFTPNNTLRSTSYTLSIKASQLNQIVSLVDNYTEQIIELAQNDETTDYSFEIYSAIPNSYDFNRFKLVFGKTTLSVNNPIELESFKLYPNPSTDNRFTISLPKFTSQEVSVEVYDMLGRNVFSENYKTDSGQIDVYAKALTSGIYLVKLSSETLQATKKLIIK